MVVTRFAPSPTGYLHIGGARTALFCYLMARRHDGRMILRIEDTDQKRNTPTATQQVIDDLRWLGIEWDEGPDVGGPNGPYLQSQRLDIYDRYLKQLIESGKAYYCFDTSEEIQTMREQAMAQKKTFLYSRPASLPDESDVEKARTQGRPVVVRFAMPDEDIVVNDIVRGEVTFSAAEMSDFIIQKSDGYPTYHFACVVDDELMEVTHIIRGQEHLMNTPQHQALQQALGFRTPTYAHMSVTVSESGGKLSKRERAKAMLTAIKNQPDVNLDELAGVSGITRDELDDFIAGNSSPDQPAITGMARFLHVPLPEINVIDFCKSGYIPEALLNFVALLGWNPGDDREIMSKDELIAAFDIERLTKTNSLFDRKKLVAFNTEHMRKVEPDTLLTYFKNYLSLNDSPLQTLDDDTLKILLQISEGARTLADIDQKCRFLMLDDDAIEFDPAAVKKVLFKGFNPTPEQQKKLTELVGQIKNSQKSIPVDQYGKIEYIPPQEEFDQYLKQNREALVKCLQHIAPTSGLTMLALIHQPLRNIDSWNHSSIHDLIMKFCNEYNIGMGKIAQPLRVAITGTAISPSIVPTLVLLGREKTLKRIENTLCYIHNTASSNERNG